MNINEKRIFVKNIKLLDPKEELVSVDLDRNEIRYNERIKQHRKIRELGDEELVRAYVVTKLITQLNYPVDCIELERSHVIGRKEKKQGARIDVLVRNNDKSFKTFMIIEVKAPSKFDGDMEEIKTQLFEIAKLEKGTKYLIYYTAYITEKTELRERVVSISFSNYDSYKDWEQEGKPNLTVIPKKYGLISKPVFKKGGIPDLRTDIKLDELESIRRELHNVLWGGGRYQGNEIFLFIMKLFLAKIYDEKETEDDGGEYKFQIFLENGATEDPEKVYKRINYELYQKALVKYLKYDEKEAKKHDVREIGDRKTIGFKKVKFVVDKLQDISLTNNVYDILGNFFEHFLWLEFKQSKGQFFTHPNIVKFIVQAMGLSDLATKMINEEGRLPYIIDPSCGSGTFLIETMKTITEGVLKNKDRLKKTETIKGFVQRNFPIDKKNAWAVEYIYGIDFNDLLTLATKVNMVMHGDGSVNIEAKDALSDFSSFDIPLLKKNRINEVYNKPINEQFDVIISNPPFSIQLEKETEGELPNLFMYGDKQNSENLFIERWYQLLKEGGILGVVLPESVFDTKENIYIRLFLYKYFRINAIISLPQLAFEPYTSTKTSLLFAKKKTEDEVKEYEKVWQKYKNEFEMLEKDLKKLLDEGKQVKLGMPPEELKRMLVKLLKAYIQDEFEEGDENLDVNLLKEKYKIFTDKGSDFNINSNWWVFTKVSKEFDYSIFMANVADIGYKRTTRSEKERPNDLSDVVLPKLHNKGE